jgi:AcrR family transcriptional regulator
LALLSEVGYEKLTLEAVAARAGVGKPTIYRWWSGKPGLVADVLLTRLDPLASFPDTGHLKRDLEQQMGGVARAFSGPEGRWLSSLIVAAQADVETAERLRTCFLQPRREAAARVLRQAMERGEVRPNVDVEVLIDALYAPFYHRLLTGYSPLNEAFVQALLDTVLQGAVPR